MQPTPRNSLLLQTPVEEVASFPLGVQEANEAPHSPQSNEKIDIVISAHPQEKLRAEQIMQHLRSKGYSVWSTAEMDKELHKLGIISPTGEPHGHTNMAFTPPNRNLNWIPEIPTPNDGQHTPASRVGSNESDAARNRVVQRSNHFSRKAAQTTLVIFIISDDFLRSTVSMQQVFYCQKRKHVIVVKTELSKELPCWWDSLMGVEAIDVSSFAFVESCSL